MKLSVSLTDDDVAALDAYVRDAGLPSRSAAVQEAVRRLKRHDLTQDYADAFAEWDASGDRDGWEATSADGLGGGGAAR